MSVKTGCWFAVAALILSIVQPVTGELTDTQVRNAIERGSSFLKTEQKSDGHWTEHSIYVGGVTALTTLALLNSGEDVKSPTIQKSLAYLRSLGEPSTVYATSLQTMAMCAAEPAKDAAIIGRNVKWLEAVQLRGGLRKGAWNYADKKGSGDNSNTQFALLALHEAHRIGIEVKRDTWELALDYWLRTQREDGSWGYTESEPATGSMTCAGIGCVVICQSKIGSGDARLIGSSVECCGTQTDDDAIERAMQWLSRHFSTNSNPSSINLRYRHLFYYLYAVERTGRLTGRRFIGRHDWYREGATTLLNMHDDFRGSWSGAAPAEDVPTVATSLALLFLAKGRRPVVMSKLQYGENQQWDLHRSAVQHLTERVEQRWKRDLSWQTVDVRAATLEDLLQTPVLCISGREAFELTVDQKENLRQYVNQGGFIFAEACCNGEAFDRSFRALMNQLFPDSSLRLLPEDHPVWYAEEKVNAKYLRPLFGIDACCRTSVVYCPKDLSCFWELDRGVRNADYPKDVQEEVEACLAIGKNVVTYATSRELKNKLDRPQIAINRPAEDLERSVLYMPKLRHDGGSDDAPNALPNMLNFVRSQAQLRIDVTNRMVSATSDDLFDYPIVYMHGRRAFRFSPDERKAIATFVDRGGVIFADAICASPEFADSFRREMKNIFPAQSLARISPEHPMFTREFRGYDLAKVTVRDPQLRNADDPLITNLTEVSPLLEGISIDDRMMVIFSPYDISCAMENSNSLECKGYLKEDAAKIATNVVLFVLQQ
ncbi:MAG: DUF4159 domain-containing protein [Planctomycetaceae bacterium]|nr:DUF4159 domain-containing protein [Planctomycetaceae bacterium]MCB9937261.1 DUF4159 domain-containing protein [Planctomycetaceae bacterium]